MVTDPAGGPVKYEYDFDGDLVAVPDQLDNTMRFVYDENNRLLEVYDPLGRRGVCTEFDENGRMIEPRHGYFCPSTESVTIRIF